MKIHFPQIVVNLDPHKMEDAYSMTVVQQIHRGLLRHTPSMEVAPDLAKGWKESADHKTYTFILGDSKFSNGSEVTALNVQMSFARLFSIGAAMGADIDYIEGATEFRKSKDLSKLGITVRSTKEIEFKLEHPSALFLKHIATIDCSILPISNFKENIVFDQNTPYAGPYKVTQISDHEIKLSKWRPDQFDSKNPPQAIEFIISAETPLALAKNRKTDSLDHDTISDDEIVKLKELGWNETPTELIAETYIILSPKKVSEPLRKYLFSKIDQTELAKVLGRKYIPAFGAIPTGLPAELSESEIASLKQGISRAKGKINFEYDSGNEIHQKILSYVKDVWSKAGVEVNPVPLSKKDLAKKRLTSQCEVCIGQKGLDYPDGFSVLTYFKSGYESNYFHVSDPKIDSLINSASKILDKNERENHYKKIQKDILAHYTLIPLVFGSTASGLWSQSVAKVPPHPMGMHMISYETIEMIP